MFDCTFRALAHTADLGLEATGPNLESAFEQASIGLFELMGTAVTHLGSEQRRVLADGVDPGDLLVCLLSELLASFEIDERLLEHVDAIAIDPPGADNDLWTVVLDGRFRCIDRDREPGLAEFKAVTYHQLAVEQTDAGVYLRVIFDL